MTNFVRSLGGLFVYLSASPVGVTAQLRAFNTREVPRTKTGPVNGSVMTDSVLLSPGGAGRAKYRHVVGADPGECDKSIAKL